MKLCLAILLLFVVYNSAHARVRFPSFRDEAAFGDLREDLLRLLRDDEMKKRDVGVGTCYAYGDPHYVTFDGKSYNFMGACRYVHVTDYCNASNKDPLRFKVVSENYYCGRSVTCVNSVDVIIGGEKVHLARGITPANEDLPEYSVRNEGSNVVVRTKPSGLTVIWNKSNRLTIKLEKRFKGKVCGLCGNFDDKRSNDFLTSNGQFTNDVNTFGQSWTAGGKCGKPVTPLHPCEKKPCRWAVAKKDCAVIKSDHFKECRGVVDIDTLYHNCMYDVCAETTVSMEDSSCEAIKQASLECKDQNKAVEWGHLESKCKCQRKAKDMSAEENFCCALPFKFNSETYYDCAPPMGSLTKRWCPKDKTPTDENIGYCID